MYARPKKINLEELPAKIFVGRYSLFRGSVFSGSVFSGSVFRGSALAWVAETRLEEQVESRDKDSEI